MANLDSQNPKNNGPPNFLRSFYMYNRLFLPTKFSKCCEVSCKTTWTTQWLNSPKLLTTFPLERLLILLWLDPLIQRPSSENKQIRNRFNERLDIDSWKSPFWIIYCKNYLSKIHWYHVGWNLWLHR